jgi:CubicO group peptidase (beta-lactamase class C family)
MKEIPDSVYITKAFKDTLKCKPGTKFEYSNFGYYVLADIIRIASGLSFADYMKQYVFDPCGLIHTRTTSLQAIVPNRAAGYLEGADKRIANAPNYPAVRPSGAFLSTVQDLLKWEMAMQAGKPLTAQQRNLLSKEAFKTPLTMDGAPIYYSFGWMTNTFGGAQLVHHGGSLPGFKSVYFRLPDDHSAIIVLANADQADMYAIAFGILDRLPRRVSEKKLSN